MAECESQISITNGNRSRANFCFIYGASWAVRTPFALEERLAPAKRADSPTFVIRLVVPRKSTLAAAGHRMRIEAMVRKGERPCSPGARSPSLKAIANIPRAGRIWTCARGLSVHMSRKKRVFVSLSTWCTLGARGAVCGRVDGATSPEVGPITGCYLRVVPAHTLLCGVAIKSGAMHRAVFLRVQYALWRKNRLLRVQVRMHNQDHTSGPATVLKLLPLPCSRGHAHTSQWHAICPSWNPSSRQRQLRRWRTSTVTRDCGRRCAAELWLRCPANSSRNWPKDGEPGPWVRLV